MAGTPTTRPAFYERRRIVKRLELQERDYLALRALARWRFMRARQLLAVMGGSEQTATRRLKDCYDHKLLSRPRKQRALLADEPSPDGIYALTRTGARLIAHHDGFDIERLNHVSKNERVGAEFILHSIGIADLMLRFHLAAETAGVSAVLEQHELIAAMPEETQRSRRPFLFPVSRVPVSGRAYDINLVPDRLVSLSVAGGRLNFACEYNRTLTIHPSDASFRRNTTAWKIAGYYEGFRRGLHTARWGFERMRVLTIESTPARAQRAAALARDITGDRVPGFFLFTDIATVRAHGVYGTETWINHRGEHDRLVA